MRQVTCQQLQHFTSVAQSRLLSPTRKTLGKELSSPRMSRNEARKVRVLTVNARGHGAAMALKNLATVEPDFTATSVSFELINK